MRVARTRPAVPGPCGRCRRRPGVAIVKHVERPAAPPLASTSYADKVTANQLEVARARLGVADLVDLPLLRVPHLRVIERCWELRHNLTVYDASYVALAALLDLILVTGDVRLAKAPGLRCTVELVS